MLLNLQADVNEIKVGIEQIKTGTARLARMTDRDAYHRRENGFEYEDARWDGGAWIEEIKDEDEEEDAIVMYEKKIGQKPERQSENDQGIEQLHKRQHELVEEQEAGRPGGITRTGIQNVGLSSGIGNHGQISSGAGAGCFMGTEPESDRC